MIDLNPDEQKVFDSVVRHGTSGGINPDCICVPHPGLHHHQAAS